MIRFLVLRHAPTDWNAEGRIQGRTNVPLSAAGALAAHGWRLPPEAGGRACVASPLDRAMATARALGLDPVPSAGLIEMDWGSLEGRRLADIRSEGGASFAADEARGLDFRPGGGETPREVGDRALETLRSLSADAVVVTHKGVLRALLSLATGWDMRGKPPVRLRDACCHRFALTGEGEIDLTEANIPLAWPMPEGTASPRSSRDEGCPA